MKYKWSIVFFIIALTASATLALACEPATTLEIRNNTPQTLEVFLFSANDAHVLMSEGDPLGTLEPGSVLRKKDIAAFYFVYLFEGRDKTGKVVYSKYFTLDEMRKAKWKIVINATDLISQ